MTPSRRVYEEVHGPGPWSCEDCGCEVVTLGVRSGEGQIHHIDENRNNNLIENLALLCRSCHALRHRYARARPRSTEARRKTSESMLGHPVTAETRKKIGDAQRGRKYSDERRSAMRAGWARRKERLAVSSTTNKENSR